MPIFLVTFLFLSSNGWAKPLTSWIGMAKISQIYKSHNDYRGASNIGGLTSTNTVTYNLLGVGAKYQWILGPVFYLEPGLFYQRIIGASDSLESNFSFVQLMLDLGVKTTIGSFFFGPITHYLTYKTDPLSYTPGLGVRLGYRTEIDENSLIEISHEMIRLKSENPAGNVYDQVTDLYAINLAYGYRF